MEALLIGIATAFNFLIIKWKIEKKRYEDAGLDFIILVILSMLFSGSLGGMVIATIASAIVSIMFMVSPPKFLTKVDSGKSSEFLKEFKNRMPK